MPESDDAIFLITDNGDLQEIPRKRYESEDLLQSLLEKHPNLLAGKQIDPEEPVRWLLVRREAAIPDADGASDRWALDHLLLDQHGRPTFVEVKRSTDTRIRREVVGQMLDYAANAQVHWPADKIRALSTETHGGSEQLDLRVRELLRDELGDQDVEAYWTRVEQNLRSGRVRLLFVADELPRELRRVIEFMNEQMPEVEVLGVELRQYVGDKLRALAPRVVGQTERALQQSRPGEAGRSRTTAEGFLDACPTPARDLFVYLLGEAEKSGLVVYWGHKGFSIRVPRSSAQLASLIYGWPPGLYAEQAILEAYLGYLVPEDEPDAIRALLLAAAPFNERGRHTLRLVLDDRGVPAARGAIDALLRVADKLKRT